MEEMRNANGDATVDQSSIAPPMSSTLNPLAQEWDPVVNGAPEAGRSLFMTFSRGFPLTREELLHYFRERYDGLVHDVYVHTPRGDEPIFGRVVFTASFVPGVVLRNQATVGIWVSGRPVRLKRWRT